MSVNKIFDNWFDKLSSEEKQDLLMHIFENRVASMEGFFSAPSGQVIKGLFTAPTGSLGANTCPVCKRTM